MQPPPQQPPNPMQPPMGNPFQPQLPPPPSTDTIPIYVPSDIEQREIVSIANKFKIACLWHAKKKKTIMQKSYAYIKSEWFDSRDLLPRPDAAGSDRDNNPQRPQIFLPVSREVYKMLSAYLRLTLFPTDEDYFRIRAKTDDPITNLPPKQVIPAPMIPGTLIPMGPPTIVPYTYPDFEEILTEGMKYVFRQAKIPYKIGNWIDDLIWSGQGDAMPTMKQNVTWSWDINMQTQQYEPSMQQQPPELDLIVWDPIHFYIDPKGKEKGREQWGYFNVEKVNELQDIPYYFNKDKLAGLTSTQIYESQVIEGLYLNQFNKLTNIFLGDEQNVDVDHYYFPYLKLKSINPNTNQPREFRNMLVTVAGGRILIECRPNMTPGALPPVVHWTYREDKESPYGTGPIEDIQGLQRHINILTNYLIECLARIGNRIIVKDGTDTTEAWGLVAGLITCENPETDVRWITGDYVEIKEILNYIGILKAELQLLAGTQDPFQGSSQMDFKKTATEINVLQENAISINRETIEHISVGAEIILERFMYLVADNYKNPLRYRTNNPQMPFATVDFSLLNSGQYEIELIGANPAQSKQAQSAALTEFMTGFLPNPQAMMVFKPVLVKAFGLQGIKDGDEIIEECLENLRKLQSAQPPPQQPGVPPTQGGVAPPQSHPGGGQPMGHPGGPIAGPQNHPMPTPPRPA
jgi:hypothetical protein